MLTCSLPRMVFQYPIHGSDHGNQECDLPGPGAGETFSTLSTGLTMGTGMQLIGLATQVPFSTLSTGLTMGTDPGARADRDAVDLSVPYPRV